MAIQVKSVQELRKVMMSLVKNGMQQTSSWLVKEVKDVVDNTVYDAYTPKRYERTESLINSIDITNTKSSVEAYSLIVGHKPASWHSIGKGSIDYVPQIVHNGKTGAYVGIGTNQYGDYVYHKILPRGTPYGKPRPYMDKAVESLKSGNKYLHQLVDNIGNGAQVV